MNTNQIQLLNNYLSGNCTSTELEAVKQLLNEPGTEEVLHQLMIERTEEYEAAIPDEVLAEKIKNWEAKVVDKIESEIPVIKISTPRKYKVLRYAAVSAGILLAGYLVMLQIKKATQSKQEAYALVEQFNSTVYPVRYQLPDGSEVFLGAGSTIRYQQHFKTSREIHLSGEAFFNVQPDQAKPFIVQSRSMQTRVLGTSFKIEAQEHYPLVIAVATGKVSVSTSLNEKSQTIAALRAGQKLSFNDSTRHYQLGTTDLVALQQWTAGDLVFDEQPLGLVMQQLEKRYHLSISFSNPATALYKVSGSFEKDQDIHSVLMMLGTIGKFKHTFSGKQSVQIK